MGVAAFIGFGFVLWCRAQADVSLVTAAGRGNVEATLHLLEAGADPNVVLPPPPEGPERTGPRFALGCAAARGHEEVVRVLLNEGAYPDLLEDVSGSRALHLACEGGHSRIVKLLLNSGSSMDIKDASGFTPLLYAARHHDSSTMLVLLDAAEAIAEETGSHPIDLETPDPEGKRALHLAAQVGAVESVRCLLKAGADPGTGGTHSGDTVLRRAAREGNEEFVALLLEHVDVRDAVAALFWAASEGHLSIVRRLLDAGSPIDEVYQGHTPLLIAAARGYAAVVQELVDRGADTTIRHITDRYTPLEAAKKFGRDAVVEILEGRN